MKLIYKLVLIWAIVISAVACTKVTSNEGQNTVFTEKLDSIQRGEPVLLSFNNGNNATVVTWSVTPSDSVTLEKAGAYATFYFAVPGTYTVVASANSKQATYQVKVINKTYNDIGSGFSVTASKTVGVQLNETVLFTAHNANSSVYFSTINSTIGVFNPTGSSALISFRGGSSGTVVASDSFHSQSRTIWLSDSLLNPSLVTVPFIFSDKLNITPSVITDSLGNKTLVLSTKTTYNYQSTSDQILNFTANNKGSLIASYGGVTMSAAPQASVSPATCVNTFYNLVSSTSNTYPFSVNYGNYTFTGTLTVNPNGVFTFNNWLPNGYVSIYPLTVQ
ncbi:MAG: hypothetical protein WCP65_01875 [Bacteroidota bacterium]